MNRIRCAALTLLIAGVAACDSTTTPESTDPQVVVEGIVLADGLPVANADVKIEVHAPDCNAGRYTGELELTTDNQGRFRHVWDIFSRSTEIRLCAIAVASAGELIGVDTVHSVALRARSLTPDTARFSVAAGN